MVLMEMLELLFLGVIKEKVQCQFIIIRHINNNINNEKTIKK